MWAGAARAGRELPCRQLPAGGGRGLERCRWQRGVPAPPSLRSALLQGVLSLLGVGPPGSAGAAETGRQPAPSPGRVGRARTQVVRFPRSEGRAGRVPASCREPVPTDLTSKIPITSPGPLRSCLRVWLCFQRLPTRALHTSPGLD